MPIPQSDSGVEGEISQIETRPGSNGTDGSSKPSPSDASARGSEDGGKSHEDPTRAPSVRRQTSRFSISEGPVNGERTVLNASRPTVFQPGSMLADAGVKPKNPPAAAPQKRAWETDEGTAPGEKTKPKKMPRSSRANPHRFRRSSVGDRISTLVKWINDVKDQDHRDLDSISAAVSKRSPNYLVQVWEEEKKKIGEDEKMGKNHLRFVLPPESNIRRIWSTFFKLMAIAYIFALPVGCCIVPGNMGLLVFELTVDALFFFDILVTSRCAILLIDGRMLATPGQLSHFYGPYILMDVLQSVPYGLLGRLMSRWTGVEYWQFLYLAAYPRMTRFIRRRQGTVASLSPHAQQAEGLMEESQPVYMEAVSKWVMLQMGTKNFVRSLESFFRLSTSFVAVLVVIHIVACGWGVIAAAQAGSVANFWKREYPTAYMAYFMHTMRPSFEPNTTEDQIYTIVSYLSAFTVLRVFAAQIFLFIGEVSKSETEYNAKLQSMLEYMRSLNLPPEFQERATNFQEYKRVRNSSMTVGLQSELSASMVAEVALFTNQDLVRNTPMFRGCSLDFIEKVVLKLRQMFHAPDELIIRKYDISTQLYFISKGTAAVIDEYERYHKGKGKVIAYLAEGQLFGETIATENHEVHKREATVRAVTFCETMTLLQTHLEEVLHEYPHYRSRLGWVVAKRHEQIAATGKIDDALVIDEVIEVEKMVQRIPILSTATAEFCNRLMTKLEGRAFGHGDMVYKVGDRATGLFFVMQGNVQLTDKAGELITILPPGSCFGERVIQLDIYRMETATAQDPSKSLYAYEDLAKGRELAKDKWASVKRYLLEQGTIQKKRDNGAIQTLDDNWQDVVGKDGRAEEDDFTQGQRNEIVNTQQRLRESSNTPCMLYECPAAAFQELLIQYPDQANFMRMMATSRKMQAWPYDDRQLIKDLMTIYDTLLRVKLFSRCDPDFIHALMGRMRMRDAEPGDVVCTRGEKGSCLYIVHSGLMHIVEDETAATKYVCGRGGLVGEVSVVLPVCRTASLVAAHGKNKQEKITILELYRQDLEVVLEQFPQYRNRVQWFAMMRYRKIQQDAGRKGRLTHMGSMSREIMDDDLMNSIYRLERMVASSSLLQTVADTCRDNLIMSLVPISFPTGSMVVKKGELGEEMYFVARGSVEVLSSNGDRLTTFTDGGYFGEVSLLSSGRRLHSVRTTEATDMYALHRDAFLRLIDHFPEDVEVFVMTALKRTLGALKEDMDLGKRRMAANFTDRARKKVKALIKLLQTTSVGSLSTSHLQALLAETSGETSTTTPKKVDGAKDDGLQLPPLKGDPNDMDAMICTIMEQMQDDQATPGVPGSAADPSEATSPAEKSPSHSARSARTGPDTQEPMFESQLKPITVLHPDNSGEVGSDSTRRP